jgi:hypothetical protein
MTGSDTSGTAELEKLAAELDGRAYVIILETGQGKRPHLSVTNRDTAQRTEFVYAAPADDGAWWFWWGWAQRIAPADDVPAAAAAVGRVLRVPGGTR